MSDDCKNKLKSLFTLLLKEHTELTVPILNLLLVCYGVRPAFLYEESSYNKRCTLLFNTIIKLFF